MTDPAVMSQTVAASVADGAARCETRHVSGQQCSGPAHHFDGLHYLRFLVDGAIVVVDFTDAQTLPLRVVSS